MYIRDHLLISGIVFGSIEGILGGIITDIFFTPVAIYDYCRKRRRLPFKELDNMWIKLNWFLHTIWFLLFLGMGCYYFDFTIFWKAYFLHIVLDVCTHTQSRALKLLYPFSDWKLDLWAIGYVKGDEHD